MSQLYVRELCGLLRDLGITQEAIAVHLGCARTSVAGWIQGQRPVPERHLARFLDFVRSKIAEACPPSEGEHPTAIEAQIRVQLARWGTELSEANGFNALRYEGSRQQLLRYLHLDPAKLSHEEVGSMLAAARELAQGLREQYNLRRPLAAVMAEIPHLPTKTLLAYFDELVRWGMQTFAPYSGHVTPKKGTE